MSGGGDHSRPPQDAKPAVKPGDDKQQADAEHEKKTGAVKGVVVRAIIAVMVTVGAALFLIDWNAIVWETSRQETNDAQLRGNPT